jgi:hypothetical protein
MPIAKTLIAAAALGTAGVLAGCTDYGYSSVGYSAGIYDGGFGDPYWGWYDDYYYPGTGVYVYDSGRRRHRWNEVQRSYWQQRHQGWRGDRGRMRADWRDFRRGRPDDGRGGRPRR